jgi:3-hydroxybutyryl-CoA dehydrogenase
MSVNTLAVIGAGTMGRGIAETAATHGFNVIFVEISAAQRDAARQQMTRSIAKGIARAKIDATDPAPILGRIEWCDSLSAAAAAEFVIEAVSEDPLLKQRVFRELDQLCPPATVLASNTSSISIGSLAEVTTRAGQVIGMHFFNPVPIMTPIEIVRGPATTDAVIDATRELAVRLGKQPFVVRDRPGFVVNRVLMPLINEAIFALRENIADAATIDELMKQGCNHPMGPLALADLVGLDVCLSILEVLHRELADEKFRPCPMLVEMVRAGRLGRKSGRGFHEYA